MPPMAKKKLYMSSFLFAVEDLLHPRLWCHSSYQKRPKIFLFTVQCLAIWVRNKDFAAQWPSGRVPTQWLGGQWFKSMVGLYQRPEEWDSMPPCFTPSMMRLDRRVKPPTVHRGIDLNQRPPSHRVDTLPLGHWAAKSLFMTQIARH